MKYLLYVHGFLSSPQSYKALATARWLAQHRPECEFICPELSSYPDEAVTQLKQCIAPLEPHSTFVIGSSLGGFWATWLVENSFANKAVLINPAVAPHKLVQPLLGQPLKNYYSDAVYTIEPHHLGTLMDCESTSIKKSHAYWLMVQTGDETLPYKQSVEKYQGCKQTIETGGSHTFEGFENWLPGIIEFFES